MSIRTTLMLGEILLGLVWAAGALPLAAEAGPEPPPGKPAPRTDRVGDPLPAGVLFRIGTTRLQHGAEVRALAASPDGKLLAAVSNDRTLSLWDTANGKEVHRIVLEETGDGWIAFTPDSKRLAFNRGGKLCLLDVASREVRKTLGSAARKGVFAADGKTLTVVQDDGGVWSPAIRRWDLDTGKPLGEWQFRPEPPQGDGGGIGFRYDFTLATWLSADGKILASLESDRSDQAKEKQTLRLHDAVSGKELRRWLIPAPSVYDLALSLDGKFVVTGSGDTTLRVWDASTGKEIKRWKADSRENISYGGLRVALAPDGESLLSNGPGGLIRWDWRAGKQIRTYPDTWGPIAFLQGGKALAVLGYVNSLWVLDTETGKDLCPLPRPGHRVAFSPDGRLIAWPESGALVLADSATGKEVHRWMAHPNAVGALTFAPDGKTLASAGTDKRIRIWNVADGHELRSMPHEWVSRLAFSADGSRLASVSGWHTDVCIWDVVTGERRHRWQGDRLTTLDPGLRVVASADRAAKVLRLADVATGKVLHTLPGYQERVGHHYNTKFGGSGSHGDFPPLFSPDGRLLLAGASVPDGDKDGAVYFWDVITGKRLQPILDGKKFVFENMAFSPDSRLLALTRSDCTMCLMNPATGEVVRTLGQAEGPMTAPPTFTRDGRTVVTVVKGLIQVWEIATGGEICRRQGHRGDIDGLFVSGNGRALATVAWDHTILVWDLARLVPDNPPSAPLTSAQLEAVWNELASPNAVTGRRAVETLIAVPAQAVALIAKRLPPTPVPDAGQVGRWIVDLGSDEFEQRQQAVEGLDQLGEAAGPALRKALAANPSLEARRRMEDLQKKLSPAVLPPEALRMVRAVQTLETLASPEAQRLLIELARGAAEVRLTTEAGTALRRMESKPGSSR